MSFKSVDYKVLINIHRQTAPIDIDETANRVKHPRNLDLIKAGSDHDSDKIGILLGQIVYWLKSTALMVMQATSNS